MAKRRKPAQKKQAPAPSKSRAEVPSAATFFRLTVFDEQSSQLIHKAQSRMKPLLWLRDGGNVRQIEKAQSPEELLELLPLATGLADSTWFEQMRKYGPEALPLLAERLKSAKKVADVGERDLVTEKLITELRWRGPEGADALLDCFDSLTSYGKSLACVVLGRLGARKAADKIWDYYQQAKKDRQENRFTGALWGLIDLGDPRAGLALSERLGELLDKGRDFYELYGFLALAGDASAVTPLLRLGMQMPVEEKTDSMMAMIAIGHRIGREALASEIEKAAEGETSELDYNALADIVLSKPVSIAEEYFETYYRGFQPEDVKNVLDE